MTSCQSMQRLFIKLMMKTQTLLIAGLFLLPSLSSCLYLTPEGRRVRVLRQQQMAKKERLTATKEQLNRAQSEYYAAKAKYLSRIKTISAKPAPRRTPAENSELNQMKQEMVRKEQQLHTLQNEVNALTR